MARTAIGVLCLLVSLPAWGFLDASGLKASISADIGAQAGLSDDSGATNKVDVRETEVMFYSPADHLFDGVASFAAHMEGGKAGVEVHEVVVRSSRLIPRSRFRLGQFFLGVGRLNQFHRHDWPFTSAPRYHTEFFSAEGVLDTGGEYTFLAPLPFFLELTAGMTNGFTFGHDHSKGMRPHMPTHYLRAATYTDLPWAGGAQLGLNYMGRRGRDGTNRTLLGVDLAAKWRENREVNFLLQSEVWLQMMTPAEERPLNTLGYYVYPEYYLGENFFLGVRFEFYSKINLTDAFGDRVANFELGLMPALTFRPSEFSTVRLSYQVRPEYQVDRYVSTRHYVEFQAVLALGAHPAHDF